VPEDLTTQGRPAGPAPAPPLVHAPATLSAPRHPWRRAVILALLVLVVGAALGAAGFAAEQRAFVWKPSVSETSDGGWLVTGSAGLRPDVPVIADGRLVWGQGPYTCVLDLDDGDTHVVGAAPRGTSIWPPAADGRYVAWIEMPGDDAQGGPTQLWIYDADRGRRHSFTVTPGAATTAVDGDLVAWFDGGQTPRVVALDMGTQDRSVIAQGEGLDYPVLAGDGLVGWLQPRADGRAPSVVLYDIDSGEETTVKLAADGSGLSVGDIQLCGRILLWTLQGATTTSIVVHDVHSGTSSVIASGAVENPATDGEVIVWVVTDDPSGTPVVRGRTLGDGAAGAEFEVGRPKTWPSSLAVGGQWVAWSFDDGSWSYLESVKALP